MNKKTYKYFLDSFSKDIRECNEMYEKSVRARKIETKLELTVRTKHQIKQMLDVIEDFITYAEEDMSKEYLEILNMTCFALNVTKNSCNAYINKVTLE